MRINLTNTVSRLAMLAANTDTGSEAKLSGNNQTFVELAKALAGQLDADETAVAYIEETINAMEMAKRGPVAFLFDVLTPLYGDLQEAGFPRSTGEDDSPDKFTVQRTNKDGTTRNVNTDFASELAADTSMGRKYQFIIDQCGLAMNATTIGQAEPLYQNMSGEQLEATKKSAEFKKANLRRAIRTAQRVYYVKADIAKHLSDKVIVDFVTVDEKDEDGKDIRALTRSPNAMFIADKASPTKSKAMTAGQFIQLDVTTAMANGGTYKALLDTVKREGTSGGRNTGANRKSVETVDAYVETVYDQASFVGVDGDASDHDPVKMAAIIRRCSTDPEFLLAFGDYASGVANIFAKVEADYLLLNDKRSSAARAEMIAKDGTAKVA